MRVRVPPQLPLDKPQPNQHMQKKFLIPISYKTEAVVVVYSSSFEDAIEEAHRLRDIGILIDKIDSSRTIIDDTTIKIDEERAEKMNPKETYMVTVKRNMKATLEIIAHSATDAENIAQQMMDNDELHSSDFEEIDDHIVGSKLNS